MSTRKGFRSSRKGFVNLFPNLGKLLKILGKVSFQNFPKLPWERKGKGKLSVLPPKASFRIVNHYIKKCFIIWAFFDHPPTHSDSETYFRILKRI